MLQRFSPPIVGSLVLTVLCALATPGFAQEPGFAAPSLRVAVDGSLLVRGDGERPLLLLIGERALGTEECGRRVRARRVLPIHLDLRGEFRIAPGVLGHPRAVQAWQAPRSGQRLGQGYSIPVSLVPAGPPLNSMAQTGDLVVTEFMKDPTVVTDNHGEWIELHNSKAWRLDIEGVTIADLGGASFTLDNAGMGILLAPGERYVIGNDADPVTNGGIAVDYQWSSFSLKNSSDEILVFAANGQPIDRVQYDDGVRWPDTPGMAIALSDNAISNLLNNDPGMWCHASSSMGTGSDTGTPGSANGICP